MSKREVTIEERLLFWNGLILGGVALVAFPTWGIPIGVGLILLSECFYAGLWVTAHFLSVISNYYTDGIGNKEWYLAEWKESVSDIILQAKERYKSLVFCLSLYMPFYIVASIFFGSIGILVTFVVGLSMLIFVSKTTRYKREKRKRAFQKKGSKTTRK